MRKKSTMNMQTLLTNEMNLWLRKDRQIYVSYSRASLQYKHYLGNCLTIIEFIPTNNHPLLTIEGPLDIIFRYGLPPDDPNNEVIAIVNNCHIDNREFDPISSCFPDDQRLLEMTVIIEGCLSYLKLIDSDV